MVWWGTIAHGNKNPSPYNGTKIKGYCNIQHRRFDEHACMSAMNHKDLDSTTKIGVLSKCIVLSISLVASEWSNNEID